MQRPTAEEGKVLWHKLTITDRKTEAKILFSGCWSEDL